ncbi:MAG: LysR family transcriptional regulator, partial [Hyphomicrobiaceae bacterium]
DLRDLRIFSRVAAVQNLTAVAGALGVSAGTVSKRIQSLEEELGVRLLDRTTRSSRLTEEGRMFLSRVERVLSEMDIAQDEISANTGQPAGRIAVTAPAALGRQVVSPAIIDFVEKFPGVEVRVDVTDAFANLHEDGYDVAIRAGTLSDCTLKAKRLATDRVILVAAPRYIERHGTPMRPDELVSHDCLIHGDQRSWTLIRGQEKSSRAVSGRLVSDSGEFLQMAALQGAGLLRTSEIAVGEDLAAGRLIHVMPDFELAVDAALWAVYPNAKHAMPRLRAFLDHLAEFCRVRMGQSQRVTAIVPESFEVPVRPLANRGTARTRQLRSRS